MPQKNWFLHVQGETLGPLPPSKVVLMLEQNEVQFSEFAWTQGFKEWTRISDIPQFASMMPEPPSVPIPTEGATASAPTATPKPALRAVPTPKAEPKPKAEEAAEAEAEPAPPARAIPIRQAPTPTATARSGGAATAAAKAPEAKIRRHERVDIKGKVTINGEKYTTINISESGVLVQASQSLKVGSEIKMKLECDDLGKALDMTGVVIREEASPKNTTAIEFTRVNPAHRRIIQEYVKKRLG